MKGVNEATLDVLSLEWDLITVYSALEATFTRYLELLLPFESGFFCLLWGWTTGNPWWGCRGGPQLNFGYSNAIFLPSCTDKAGASVNEE
jgi:hypothetical protein